MGPAGEQVGIVRIEDALRLAQEADLDLVEVAPMERPPVCKLMDYGKFKYEAAQKDREARRNQAHTVIKEMKLRPKIDPHDYETKKGHVVRFLKAGDKVKVTIMFRGREQSRPEVGYKLLQRLAGDVQELGFIETSAKQDGRNMTMVMAPHRVVKELAAKSRPVRKLKDDEDAMAADAADRDAANPDGADDVVVVDEIAGGTRHRGRADRARPSSQSASSSTTPELNSTAPPRTRRTPAGCGHEHHGHHPQKETTAAMPKMKTHSGAKKRFKLTGTGKLMREQANRRHLLEHKPSTLTRRLAADVELSPGDAKKAKRLMGL